MEKIHWIQIKIVGLLLVCLAMFFLPEVPFLPVARFSATAEPIARRLMLMPTAMDLYHLQIIPSQNVINFDRFLTGLWAILILACGVFLLISKFSGRIYFLILCGISFLIKVFVLISTFNIGGLYSTEQASANMLWRILEVVLPVIYAGYIFLLH